MSNNYGLECVKYVKYSFELAEYENNMTLTQPTSAREK